MIAEKPAKSKNQKAVSELDTKQIGYDSLTAKIQKGLQSFRSQAGDDDVSCTTSEANTEQQRRSNAQAHYQKLKSTFEIEKTAIQK